MQNMCPLPWGVQAPAHDLPLWMPSISVPLSHKLPAHVSHSLYPFLKIHTFKNFYKIRQALQSKILRIMIFFNSM